jgi:hypothetical protein
MFCCKSQKSCDRSRADGGGVALRNLHVLGRELGCLTKPNVSAVAGKTNYLQLRPKDGIYCCKSQFQLLCPVQMVAASFEMEYEFEMVTQFVKGS